MITADIAARLDHARRTGAGRWIARCPAHEDRAPSLSIRELDDGRTLIHCFGGCSVDSIVGALGLEIADLFPERRSHDPVPARRYSVHPADALACLSHEACVVLIAGRDIAAGASLPEADLERLSLATQRIAAAVEVIRA